MALWQGSVVVVEHTSDQFEASKNAVDPTAPTGFREFAGTVLMEQEEAVETGQVV